MVVRASISENCYYLSRLNRDAFLRNTIMFAAVAHWLRLLAGLIFVVSIASCDSPPLGHASQRTLIVYLAADNNLSWEMDDRLDSIAAGFTMGINGRLLVYCDKKGEAPRLLEIRRTSAGQIYQEIERYEEQNSALPQTFAAAIHTAMRHAPARSYGLLVWSHGWGWLPAGAYNNPYQETKGIFIDGTTEMPITDFAASIPDGLFDFIVMEACFMGTIEVAYQLREKAQRIVFSSGEIFVPGFIPIYPSALKYLFDKEADLVRFTDQWYTYTSTRAALKWATVSVIRTDYLEKLAAAVQAVGVPHTSSIALAGVQSFMGYGNSHRFFFDFGDVYQHLLPEEKWQRAQTLIDSTVIYKANTPSFAGYSVHRHTGFTTHIDGSYPYLDNFHATLDWHKAITTP